MAKKTIELTRDGFRTVWQSGESGMIDVNVYVGNNLNPVLEWSYGKVVGQSILGNASFWFDQVVLEARSEMRKATQ